MSEAIHKLRYIAAVLCLLFSPTSVFAEQGKLVIHVADAAGRPVANLSISTSGSGGGPKRTDSTGRAVIILGPDTKPNALVTLQIIGSLHEPDFVMVSPWDGNARVPSFDNGSSNFVAVVVVERGDKALLENGSLLASLVKKINQGNAPKTFSQQVSDSSSRDGLLQVSKKYSLSPQDVDAAIRAWGAKVTDPYDAGLAALYERKYPEATRQLTASLEMREKNFKTSGDMVVEVSSSLGDSLYAQGLYRESAAAQNRALQLRPEDPRLLNATAMSLHQVGDYAGAELLYRRALAIDEKALGSDHVTTATRMNNLAVLLEAKGDYVGGELLFRRALAIYERALGPDDRITAGGLSNLAMSLKVKGDYVGAEPLIRRALVICEKVLGPDDATTAMALGNLASLLETKGDYAGTEPLARHALAIDEKALGPGHAIIAVDLNILAVSLQAKGDYVGAEPLLRRALAIDERVFGPDHAATATILNRLAALLKAKGDSAGAEPLLRRALTIDEKVLGPDHANTAECLHDLAQLLEAKGDYSDAEPLFRRALAIDEKALGPDHATTAAMLNNLAALLWAKGDYSGAEPLLRRALAIDERALGADHPTTTAIKNNLADIRSKLK